MDMPGAWSRSLSPPLPPSRRLDPSPPRRSPEDVHDAHDASGSTAQHRAGTETSADPPPMALHQAVDSNPSLLQSIQDPSPDNQSFNAHSMSQRSSPPPEHPDGRSRSQHAESISSSVRAPRSNGGQHYPVPNTWTRNAYPLNAAAQGSVERYSPTSTLASESRLEPIPIEVYPTQNPVKNMTLRRTSRSRRIDSPLTTVADEADTHAQPEDDARSLVDPGTDSWKRHASPLQTNSLTRMSTSSMDDEAHVTQQGRPQQSPARTSQLNQQVDGPPSPISSSTALAASQQLSDSETNEPSSGQPQYSSQKMGEGKAWRVPKYPLQAPASIENFRDSPATPPPRDSYPKDLVYSHKSQAQKHGHPTKQTKTWHRQSYPLQAPASNVDLRDSLAASAEDDDAEKIVERHARQDRNSPQPTKESRSWHRQRYPLQAPASNANLRESSITIPSEKTGPEESNETPAHQSSSGSQAVRESKPWRHQSYPLQAPASNTNLGGALTPPPSPARQKEPIEEDGKAARQSREHALTTEVVNHWRRQVYPLQSPENSSPFGRLPTPQPTHIERGQGERSQPVHLPKNIPAVRDAKKHDLSGRTIVVCLDGTGDKFDNDNSNIVHLISALKKDDARQVTYYQAGVGTYGAGGLSGGVTAAMDMAVGSSLGLHVRDAYNFLMHAYKEGDKICIFGFSRGAYTARCLAGMIHKVGLLPPRNVQQISFAYEFYANDTPAGWKQSEDFKKTFCIDICVYFLGCFDSVASVGFIPRQLPLSSTPSNKPRYFRHAMALDERRAKFKICRHQTKDWEEIKTASSTTNSTLASAQAKLSHFWPNHSEDDEPPESSQTEHAKTNHPNITNEEYERLTAHEAPFDTDVLEVWFTGAHADIGGGAVANDVRHKLAQIPLRWMIRQSFECNTGIIFNTAVLAEHGLDVHTLWPKYERLSVPAHGPPPSFLEKYEKGLPSKSTRRSKLVPIDRIEGGEQFFHLKSHTDEDWTPEQVEDFYDAMTPLNDQLIQAPTWWILELWPVQYKVPRKPGEISTRTGMNLGRYRGVEDAEPNLHWTVLHRVQHTDYKIGARTTPRSKWKICI